MHHIYQVIVGNIGLVYEGSDVYRAVRLYTEYVQDSILCIGRSSNEPVTLIEDGGIVHEHTPVPTENVNNGE